MKYTRKIANFSYSRAGPETFLDQQKEWQTPGDDLLTGYSSLWLRLDETGFAQEADIDGTLGDPIAKALINPLLPMV